MRLLSLVMAIALAQIAPAVFAQDSRTVTIRFNAARESGELTGCQLAFRVLRADYEFNDGRSTLVDGLLLLDIGRSAAMLRFGAARDANFQRFEAPSFAYFISGLSSSQKQLLNKGESSEPGFGLFVFRVEEETLEAMLGTMESGTLEIGYAPLGSSADARVVVDLSTDRKVLSEWGECLGVTAASAKAKFE